MPCLKYKKIKKRQTQQQSGACLGASYTRFIYPEKLQADSLRTSITLLNYSHHIFLLFSYHILIATYPKKIPLLFPFNSYIFKCFILLNSLMPFFLRNIHLIHIIQEEVVCLIHRIVLIRIVPRGI